MNISEVVHFTTVHFESPKEPIFPTLRAVWGFFSILKLTNGQGDIQPETVVTSQNCFLDSLSGSNNTGKSSRDKLLCR